MENKKNNTTFKVSVVFNVILVGALIALGIFTIDRQIKIDRYEKLLYKSCSYTSSYRTCKAGVDMYIEGNKSMDALLGL